VSADPAAERPVFGADWRTAAMDCSRLRHFVHIRRPFLKLYFIFQHVTFPATISDGAAARSVPDGAADRFNLVYVR
jgi:hypothetical protein